MYIRTFPARKIHGAESFVRSSWLRKTFALIPGIEVYSIVHNNSTPKRILSRTNPVAKITSYFLKVLLLRKWY
jgi:hypothetical protein